MAPANVRSLTAPAESAITACWNIDTLKDVKTGWAGECKGLTPNTEAKTMEACETTCRANTNCPVWQYSGEGEADGAHCDQGIPTGECATRAGFKANGGQRLKHGDTKVIKSAMGEQVMNLKNVGMLTKESEETDADRCKRECYSIYSCGVWQYGEKGCWIEAYPNNIHSLKLDHGSAFAADVKAGEFVEHFCPPKPPAEKKTNWLPIGLAIAGGVLVLGALLCYLCKKVPKVKKSRAVKLAAPAPPAEVPLMFIPQPTVLVQQPQQVVQMVQQPSVVMTQAAPVMQQVQQVQYQQVAQQASVVYR